jgi:polysaccharide pyruvyl transferase WcaK-like protein
MPANVSAVNGLSTDRSVRSAVSPDPRVALLTPYTGGNLGDAAIQDAMIANLRSRLPAVQVAGISLNCDNFVERHGEGSFPLCGTGTPFYGMSSGSLAGPNAQTGYPGGPSQTNKALTLIRKALRRVSILRETNRYRRGIVKEVRHWIDGYRFLRTQNLLIVSGGGQLDEEWGGSWGHPYALFKWAVLAKIAQVPYAIASVGACKISSPAARLFLSAALRMSRYRSYRESHSREIAASLFQGAAEDPVVPDLAFTLPSLEQHRSSNIRSIAMGRPIVAISPIAYAKPGSWPYQNQESYGRYLHEMARVVAVLLKRSYFLVFVCSSLGDDQSVISEVLARLDDECRDKLSSQMHIPTIGTWKDLVACLHNADFLIASRLHSTILGFVTQTPTVAISFDPKVDRVMEDLGMTDCLLQIRDFAAEDVTRAIDRIAHRRNAVLEQIASYQNAIASNSAKQYDVLAALAVPHSCH